MKMFDVAVIGGGPAGLGAALYLARANLNVIVFDTFESMGKNAIIENYLGIDKIKLKDLVEIGRKQVEKFGGKVRIEKVFEIRYDGKDFILITSKNRYKSKFIILTIGRKWISENINGEEKFIGKGVSYCVTCDGPLFKNKRVVIVGNDFSALFMTKEVLNYTKNVKIITNGNINKNLKEEINKLGIEIIEEKVEEICGKDCVEYVLLNNNRKIECDAVFISKKNISEHLSKSMGIAVDKNGYVIVDENNKTNISRIYAAGDCTIKRKQVAIAVGDGVNAALSIIEEMGR